MCCLDPMGFEPSQALTIPFLVLLKAIQDHLERNTQNNEKILGLVMDTCVNLLEYNEALRTKVIQQSNAFDEGP